MVGTFVDSEEEEVEGEVVKKTNSFIEVQKAGKGKKKKVVKIKKKDFQYASVEADEEEEEEEEAPKKGKGKGKGSGKGKKAGNANAVMISVFADNPKVTFAKMNKALSKAGFSPAESTVKQRILKMKELYDALKAAGKAK